tara:strand:- start:109 stop:372 length:264 start_codon:yes stop_codon:yes gene_type:complete
MNFIKKEKEKAKLLRKSRWWQILITKATCYYCNKTLTPKEVTMDHIVPLSRGGRTTKGNVVPSCKECNTKKKDKTASDLMLEKISKE